jgi:CO/xanthine dehydrogenase FAD-binding subunit
MGGIRVEDFDFVIGALARMAEVASHPDTVRLQPLIAETLTDSASNRDPRLRRRSFALDAEFACPVSF